MEGGNLISVDAGDQTDWEWSTKIFPGKMQGVVKVEEDAECVKVRVSNMRLGGVI